MEPSLLDDFWIKWQKQSGKNFSLLAIFICCQTLSLKMKKHKQNIPPPLIFLMICIRSYINKIQWDNCFNQPLSFESHLFFPVFDRSQLSSPIVYIVRGIQASLQPLSFSNGHSSIAVLYVASSLFIRFPIKGHIVPVSAQFCRWNDSIILKNFHRIFFLRTQIS